MRFWGMSFMELSHRDADGPVQTMMKTLVSNLRELLQVFTFKIQKQILLNDVLKQISIGCQI